MLLSYCTEPARINKVKRFFKIKETWVCEKNVLVIYLTKQNKTHARTHAYTQAHTYTHSNDITHMHLR